MDEMSKNMSFEYPEKPKFPEQETGHVYFEQEADKSTEPFAKNVNVKAHTEYTSHVNGKIDEGGYDYGGDDSVLVSLIDGSITEINNDEVTSIADFAFYEHRALTTVNFPNVTSIGRSAFNTCRHLTTVDLPNATSIGGSAFSGCSALTTVNFPNVTSIGARAFSDIAGNAIINLGVTEGEISGAPWGAPNGVTINYNVRPTQEG